MGRVRSGSGTTAMAPRLDGAGRCQAATERTLNGLFSPCSAGVGDTAAAMVRMSRAAIPALVIAVLLGAAASAGGDHERAREALREGRILPLSTILDRVARDFPGELLEVELEGGESDEDDDHRDAGAYRYEIKLLGPDGDVTILIYDAATGRQLGARGHDLEDHAHEPHHGDDD
jgi:uncharacterized membrane protein YkoI